MAKAGHVYHWKHGWIPLDSVAMAELARRRGSGKKSLSLKAPSSKTNVPGGKLLDALHKDGGFTYDPRKGDLVKVGSMDGVAVARPGTERIVGHSGVSREAFAHSVADVIEAHGDEFKGKAMLGGWYSEDRGVYMVEVTDVFPDRKSAVKAGRDRNQEGVFDLKTGDFIGTGGTGDHHEQLALQNSAVMAHPDVGPVAPSPASISVAQVSTGPGQPHWPADVPAIKDVGVRNAEEGKRLSEAYRVAGGLLDGYKAAEPSITPKLVTIAATNGGYMMGLENKLKTRDSLTRKLYSKAPQKGMTPTEYGGKIGDALRFTMIAPPEGLTSGTQSVLDSFRKQGYTVDVENTWGIPGATYRGINVNLSKDGRTFEVQFHTAESFAAKDAQHPLYDIARADTSTPLQVAQANAQMRANMDALTVPPGIEKVR